jgi:hypothetical protein
MIRNSADAWDRFSVEGDALAGSVQSQQRIAALVDPDPGAGLPGGGGEGRQGDRSVAENIRGPRTTVIRGMVLPRKRSDFLDRFGTAALS